MHPDAAKMTLLTPWTWWEHEHSGDYNSSTLGTCDNIASFWQYFNNIPQPESFFTSAASKRKLVGRRKVDSLSLFREGIKPEWEDPQNERGGEVLFRSDKLELVNSMWYELVLALVGQVIPTNDGEILGVRVLDKSSKTRIEYRVEVWYSEGVDACLLMEELKSLLAHLRTGLTFAVRNHSSTLQKTMDKSRPKGKTGGKDQRSTAQPSRASKLPVPAAPATNNMRVVHVG
eukprot:TRINITY_DN3174_c0_g1_i1.p1 TRINITY_DN3174_c0_g1~~TRINITY_DN3174_c0_g1_i1.p1  ORF type:complete len:231 (-),score=48.79 TRINITY_DN3174_c0_g1_i1:304-996(-)